MSLVQRPARPPPDCDFAPHNLALPPLPVSFSPEDTVAANSHSSITRVRRRSDGHCFALKVYHQPNRALANEIAIMRRLDHPKILPLRGLYSYSGSPALLLDMMDCDLATIIANPDNHFETRNSACVVYQLLLGIEYLHSQGVVHCDLKACNILFDDGFVKIADFELSQLVAPSRIYTCRDLDARVGTLQWLAPELRVDEDELEYNGKIDIWGLGCIALELLSRDIPYGSEWDEDMQDLFRDGGAPPLDGVECAIALDFLQECFVLNPSRRPTAAQLRFHRFVTQLEDCPQN